jgi:hypothetical protein
MTMRRFLAALILAIGFAAGSIANAAEQLVKDPFEYPLKWYGWVLGISVFAGVVSWVRRVRRGEITGAHIRELAGEIAIAAFSGTLTFWGCQAISVPVEYTAPLVAIAGHMGARAIDIIESAALKRAGFTQERRSPASRPAPLDDGKG